MTQVVIDLSAYAGQSVIVRFRLAAAGTLTTCVSQAPARV